jgi:membrane-associated phospholipid phosphatase
LYFFIPKSVWKKSWRDYAYIISYHFPYLLLIGILVFIHLLEVNFLDPYITSLIGQNYTSTIQAIEDGAVHWISDHWVPALVDFFVLIYIVLYPFLLWFSLFYFLVADQRRAMKTFAIGFLLIYSIAIWFYLFVPITNVYTVYRTPSALNIVLPGIEQFFYATTTSNNCFPSLHVAMILLVARAVSQTNNKRYMFLIYFCTLCVITSVIYLAIHWITDVIGGILLAFGVFYLVKRITKET